MKKLLSLVLLACLLLPVISSQAASTNLAAIRINEFMASNKNTLKDEKGESPDWIELYNAGDRDVNLRGLCLSDGKKTLDKFVFPDWVLPAHGYLIVFASGEESVSETELHAGFKLSADGERVVLSYEEEILDIVSFDAQEQDVSMARVDGRTWRYTEAPTPGEENVFPDL